MKLPIVAIVMGILVAAVHVILGATGVMTKPEWISGLIIGILIAGVGNHLRLFGHSRAKQ